MSVEISGPKGYDYQYLITLLIALEYIDKEDIEVYVEKENEEDSQVTFTEEGRTYTIDIQVKRRSDEVGVINFADWICHFQSNDSDLNLLKKVERDKNRFVLILSNSRCSDDVSLFIDEKLIHCELNKGISNDLLSRIKTAMYSCYSEDKKLSILRKKSLKEFLDNISNNNLRNILKKN